MDFQGTHFEAGKLHGATLAGEIRAELNPFLGWLAGQRKMRANQAAAWLVSRYEGLFRERMPHVLEEIQGISEGARLSYPHAFVAALRDLMPTDGCTAIACSDRNDPARPLISQTRDSTGSAVRFRIMRFRYASGHSMALLNYPGWIANTGLTSRGVSFAAFTLFAATPTKANAPGSFVKRLVLEARSTAEVIEGIAGLTFPNGGYLVGDRSGHVACIEMAAGQVGIRDVSGKAFIHGNRISSPLLPLATGTAAERSGSVPPPSNF